MGSAAIHFLLVIANQEQGQGEPGFLFIYLFIYLFILQYWV
jgi:hypothetical protein